MFRWWISFIRLLEAPVSGSSLAVMRMGVGCVMALEGIALLLPHNAAITSGTPLDHYYAGTELRFNFAYEGLEWLPWLSRPWMYALAWGLIFSGVAMSVGFCYRWAATAVFLIWGYFFAIESTRSYWQSHYYLELLTTFMMIWMPAARRWSVDAWLGWGENPQTHRGIVPFWTLFLLRGQLVITYFYAGVAKLHADWMLDAIPVRWFLANPHAMTPYRPYLPGAFLDGVEQIMRTTAAAYFISYVGTIFDLVVGFTFLFRRTRIFSLALMFIFHCTNHLLIFDDIGWFPILGMATALIFLDADWPDRFLVWLKHPQWPAFDRTWGIVGAIVFPVVGVTLGWNPKPSAATKLSLAERTTAGPQTQFKIAPWVPVFVLAWIVWQSILPMRHYFIPGDGRFTYEGFSFSWRLKSDSRQSVGHTLEIKDDLIVTTEQRGTIAVPTIHWDEWKGSPTYYRRVDIGTVLWPALPEIVVIVEPNVGERIIYNPFSGSMEARNEALSRARIREIWQANYDRQPTIKPILPLTGLLTSISKHSLTSSQKETVAQCQQRLRDQELGIHNPFALGESLHAISELMNTILASDPGINDLRRELYPFVLLGEPTRPSPFLVIEDPLLLNQVSTAVHTHGPLVSVPRHPPLWHVDRSAWRNGDGTREPGIPVAVHKGKNPLPVYYGGLGVSQGDLLPPSYLTSPVGSNDPPRIEWNSLQDLTMSKYMHVSNQAFYLRRYARRVADLWQLDYHRRPRVYAVHTGVSYNGRPHQSLVDPEVDLASVPVSWFRHNSWVRDLEMKRIPRDTVEHYRPSVKIERP